jgi:hypothetical protein
MTRNYVCEYPLTTWHSGWSPCSQQAIFAARHPKSHRFMPVCEAHANVDRGKGYEVVDIDVPAIISTIGILGSANWVQKLNGIPSEENQEGQVGQDQ